MGCRRQASPDELVRVVRTPEGWLAVGRTLPGRGAWLCAGSPRCVELARKRGAFARALRGPVRPEAIEALIEVASPPTVARDLKTVLPHGSESGKA